MPSYPTAMILNVGARRRRVRVRRYPGDQRCHWCRGHAAGSAPTALTCHDHIAVRYSSLSPTKQGILKELSVLPALFLLRSLIFNRSHRFHCTWENLFRYSLGDSPVYFLNSLRNEWMSSYPTFQVMSLMVSRVASSFRLAFSTRKSWR